MKLSLAKLQFLVAAEEMHGRILEKTVLRFNFFMFNNLIIVKIPQIKCKTQLLGWARFLNLNKI